MKPPSFLHVAMRHTSAAELCMPLYLCEPPLFWKATILGGSKKQCACPFPCRSPLFLKEERRCW